MSMKISVLTAMLLVLMVPSSSGADKKKHGAERGMLEKMEAVPWEPPLEIRVAALG
jgi:hypothetical protein